MAWRQDSPFLCGRNCFPKLQIYSGLLAASLLLSATLSAPTAPTDPPHHVFFHVQLAKSIPQPVSGRLLIFMKQGSGDKEVEAQEFHPEGTSVAAREIHDLAPGSSIEVDADEVAFPKPFATLPAGNYEAQAVLDVDHSYNYSGRSDKDWISPVITLSAWSPAAPASAASEPTLVLDEHAPQNPRYAAFLKVLADAKPGVAERQEFVSPALTAFWGKPTKVAAWVILPPGYAQQPQTKYATAYWTHGFGGNLDYALFEGMMLRKRMEAGTMPPMIWVMLDESVPQGTHEFADSVNNGPWGAALTTEFIPELEKKYRMDPRRDARFLNGHSSGGWATLQLEVNYPQVFGGTWSTSPDPSDFHDFTGPDLYAPHANMYRKPDGSPWPIMRQNGKVLATFEQFSRLEQVLGPYGGQVASFEWVFSPKGPSGAPEPMFDRVTGDVNPQVATYWRDHYDLAHIVQQNWTQRGTDLKGRIHLFVGTADTFYLDGSAHDFEAVLKQLGGDPHFTYIPDRTHFDLYKAGEDKNALFDQIGAEMYAIAHPGVDWKKPAAR
ncbi:MAG: alpha/beta hydrolase [Acidobacteriaceae bacterium]